MLERSERHIKNSCLYSLDLTTKNNLKSGFKKLHKDVTREDIQKAVKNALESLRRKAKVRQWGYIAYVSISNIHLSQGGRLGAWHAHVLLYGNPCYTIVEELKRYWTKHHYGNPIQCRLQKCWSSGKVRYALEQEQAGLFQKVNAIPLLETLGVVNGNKRTVLNAWMNQKY